MEWLCASLKYMDVSRTQLILQSVQIALATFGALSMFDLMDMYITDYKLVIEELRKKDA
jgi:hypothetical protein